MTEAPFDQVSFLMAYETEELSQEQVVAGFQHLIDSGVVWSLQGRYGREAESLIRQGLCTRPAPKPPTPGVPYAVGPYEGVTRDTIREMFGRKYRLLLYQAYNAMGLVGYECNGIAVLQEEPPSVVCDEFGCEDSGWGGPSARQIELFEQLAKCPDEKFRETVNASEKLRFKI